MAKVLAEAVGITMAPQPTLGTDPSAGWITLQPDKGSIQNWSRQLEHVERNIHSVNMTREAGSLIGWKISPSFAHDWNKDYADLHAPAAFRCTPKHPGGTGQRVYRPTAAVDGGGSADSFTVPANGALQENTLIFVRGFANSANNGIFVVSTGSTATSIKVPTASLVAEASPPSNVTIDVIGFQGATGDIVMTAAGHLTATTLDFTTLGLAVGEPIVIGTGVLGTSAYGFATRKCNCVAYISAIAAGQLTLERHVFEFDYTTTSYVVAADAGTGKTVRLILGSFYRNYPITDANYTESWLCGEKADPRAGSDGTTRYTYLEGLAVGTLTLAAPLKNKITATAAYVGTDGTAPVAAASRTGGAGSVAGDSPAQAYAALATEMAETASDVKVARMTNANSLLVGEINSWTLTLNNGVTPKEVQGTQGAIDHEWGEYGHSLSVEAYYNNSAAIDAANNDTALQWDVFAYNNQYGFVLDLPNVAIRSDRLVYEANKQVKLNFDTPTFRNETSGIACGLTIFGYVPARS